MSLRTLTLGLTLCLLGPIWISGCKTSQESASETAAKVPTATVEVKAPESQTQDKPSLQHDTKNPIAVVEMENGGVFEIELYPSEAPITVGNFIKLVEQKFYDGLIFHRVEPGFVAQTGDPTGTGTEGPGYTIKDEQTPFKHDKGAVGMAKTSQPDSAGSQWYICLEAAHFLDGRYTVFGKVIKGMDVVEQIRVGDRMKRVTIRRP